MNITALTDLHAHFLPGVDDGAQSLEVTQALLQQYRQNGVFHVMATPHFHYERMTVEAFTQKRAAAVTQVQTLLEQIKQPLEFKVGAEVMFSAALPSLDLRQLAMDGGDYILIEFSTAVMPTRVNHVLYEVLQQGYTPIIAHAERYPYVAEKPEQLYEWVSMGCLAHINARALLQGGKAEKIARRYLNWNLVHFVATDAHHPEKRPVNLAAALEKLSPEQAAQLNHNAEALFQNEYLQAPLPEKPRNLFGLWI